VACEPGNAPRLQGDREKLRQCLVNLASNAVKFTPAGGTLTVYSEVLPGEKVALRVTDTGIGIAEEHLDRIFDVFYQVDGSSTREYGGAGLGLAIVKSFAEAHGGQITASSRPGAGSTFSLVLPLRPRSEPAITPVMPTRPVV
jgi:two-component system sensor histidine kinase BarA